MSQLLHAGIIAASRQLAALIVISLILFLSAPVNETFWLPATPFLTWGYLLMAAGFALTSGQSIDITASRIFRGSYLMQLVDPKHGLKALVAQFGLAVTCDIGIPSPALSDNRDRPIFWMWLGRFGHMDRRRGVLRCKRACGPKDN
jgi:hypothetical protein